MIIINIFKWANNHRELTNTVFSGILIVLGLIFTWNNMEAAASLIFIFAFLIGGYYSAKSGLIELLRDKHLNVDVLMILAAVGASLIGYWMEAALLIFIFSLAGSLEAMARERSRNAISELMNLTPEEARRYNADGGIDVVPTKELKIGDILQVPRGATIPIDGTLAADFGVINEASVTGESVPVEKTRGAEVIGGTINEGELIDIEVSVEDEDTLFSKIVRLVDEAQSKPSRTAGFIEGIEDTYVKAVLLGVPLFILAVYIFLGWSMEESFYRGMVLLTVASPCALVASAAPATLSAISRAAKKGMVFKGGQAIDNVNQLKAIIFDKTGTLTVGKPEVVDAAYVNEDVRDMVDEVVKAAEFGSTHPIANAILRYLEETPKIEVDDIADITGKGFAVTHNGDVWKIGKRTYATENAGLSAAISHKTEMLEEQGNTVIFVSRNEEVLAYYSLEDRLKPESRMAIERLNNMGVQTIMVSGDNQRTAEYIAAKVGIKEVHANHMPDEKTERLEELREKYGTVGMVGDGINDAPALALADVGFAMGSGTDIAMEMADVVLVQDDLKQIPFALGLSRKMKNIIVFNIVFALSVVLLLIFANILQVINLPIGVLGHEGSTILVILNGLRLLNYKDSIHGEGVRDVSVSGRMEPET
ncbi:heavy metal translocating P-type ATPase [Salinicoccus halitifaciens]|uniref:Cd2+/Zn2+-exporting ATPase n=1 Tax=Salinicoccus halitifaciens TaxID=1073415 RepID=A0ABV2EAG9_9STAP|nr:heavy metal translocating P-type ATPase [Salinicoccus halitifaciens]MCD2138547.1 heavy metal translocating P-type ATPase [Salinicoccus halitifaciens]